MKKLTKIERENLLRAFRRLNSLCQEAVKEGNESLASQIGSEETAILLAVLALDENNLVESEGT